MRSTPSRDSAVTSASLAIASTFTPGSAWTSAGRILISRSVIRLSSALRAAEFALGRPGGSCHFLFHETGGVGGGLERLVAHAAQRGDEGFVLAVARGLAQLAVGVDEGFDHAGHFFLREGGADDLPGRGGAGQVAAVGAAEGDLVPLLAVLVDAED